MIDFEQANEIAVERMTSARPILKGVAAARDVIPGMRDNLLLHAGPPITWDKASGPMRGAIIGALIFEGLAQDAASAEAVVRSGEITLEPCHGEQFLRVFKSTSRIALTRKLSTVRKVLRV